MSAQIIRGNALALPLPDESVDLIVTSPPYFALRSYKDGGEHYDGQLGAEATPAEFIDALVKATAEMVRVLKPGGSIWVNLGDKYNSAASGQNGTGATSMTGGTHAKMGGRGQAVSSVRNKSLIGIPWRYAIRCIDDLGLILRAEVIWDKPNGLPESVKDRVRRSHEQWFHFTKEGRYFSAVDNIRVPHKSEQGREGKGALGGQKSLRPTGPNSGAYNQLGALPGSVWTVASEPLRVPAELGIDHFAAFPTEWPRRIILGWSPADGVVLDPFGGTGTTAAVAKALGRTGISVDMSADYCRLAEWRCNGDGHEKVHNKVHRINPKAKRQQAQQLPLDDAA